jgi:putative hydrolase of the HAD superfamily
LSEIERIRKPMGQLTYPIASLPRAARGLVLDADNVLYDAMAWWRWLAQLLRHFPLRIDSRSAQAVWRRQFLGDVHRGRREWCEAFHAMLLAIGLEPAQAEEVEAACQARRRQVETALRVLPGVKATLGQLHGAGLALAVLANSEHSGALLLERIERIGLAGLFSGVVSSVDLERTKPDPVCYFAALRAVGLQPDAVAYVGHDPEGLRGAAAIGMMTVAFGFAPPPRADVLVNRFEDLRAVVARPPYAKAG